MEAREAMCIDGLDGGDQSGHDGSYVRLEEATLAELKACSPVRPPVRGRSDSDEDDANSLACSDNWDERHKRPPRASWTTMTVNLITAGLGAGILSLPWATAGTSFLAGVGITAAVLALNAWTIMILVEAADRLQAFDLGMLLGHLPGRWGQCGGMFCNVLTWVSVFLCLISDIVVVADSLEPFLLTWMGHTQAEANVITTSGGLWWIRGPVLAGAAGLVLPLCFVDQQRLAFSSTLGILVNIYIFFVVLAILLGGGIDPNCCLLGVGSGQITMFSSLMQCAILQMCVLPMYEELEDRTPEKFGSAVAAAFTFLFVLFTAFSGCAYLAFGPGVESNVIMNFPQNIFGDIARAGMAVVIVAVYPIMMTSMIAPIRHWEEAKEFGTYQRSRIITVLIVIASAVGAVFASDLGTLNTMNGAIQVSAFIAFAPALTGLYLLGRKGIPWRVLMYVLLGVGFVASMLGLLYTDNAVEELRDSCSWETSQLSQNELPRP